MNYTKLIENINLTRERLAPERIPEIDFKALGDDLGAAATAIATLEERAEIGNRLLAVFKTELANRAVALARVKGESYAIMEKLIRSDSITLDELLTLKRDLTTEFDQLFTRKLTEPAGAAGKGEGVSEYKS